MTGESRDSRNIAVLVWVGTIFLWFVPGLLAYLLKRDDAYVVDQGVEALNWSITAGDRFIADSRNRPPLTAMPSIMYPVELPTLPPSNTELSLRPV